ncbi:hypothetical protein P5G61_05500 [Paenibacillus sp. F6_3S_P_1C]|uniref:SMODS and SLOG-associating 2TM effector domain-containing protein n=1 Tax=Paenibacillus vandeheii TaxID=3035917 RepID=A0ABT8J6F0_9BACL|nr:hypothetical protein [Paenibacillus vandeheii]MDN4600672.1 hypothetical protein [Paenibacillus vandeheii]
MADKLLKLYKKDLSLLHIMFKKMKWQGFYRSIIFLLSSIILIIVIKYSFKSDWSNASFISLIICFVVSLRDLTLERDRITKSDNNGKNYYQVRIEGLRKFLRNESIDTDPKKLDLLIKLVEKQAEEQKVPFFVGRGILLTVLLPIVSATYTNILNKYTDDLTTVLTIFLIILAVILFAFIYATFFRFIYDEFINGDYQRYKTIANDLRELHFKLV